MADKAISDLTAATTVTAGDLFLLEQNGTAKKLTGQTLVTYLANMLDGHGGIQRISKVSTSGLVDTYRIVFADATTSDFVITNGRGITSITKTATAGLVDTYTIKYNDGTSGIFTVTNGSKGDKGDSAYVWIKYASQQPTESSHSFGDIPDAWMGIYSGAAASAPTEWHMYRWFEIKGNQGKTGPQGNPGVTPKFAIGTVTTVEADQKASVTITGTAEYPVLNLSIPRGRDGADGTGHGNWNTNNVGDDGYIVGRTHYVVSAESLITETALVLNSSGTTDVAIKLITAAGKPIKVTWDGTDYTCAMRDISNLEDTETFAIGNLSIMDAAFLDSGEPFLFKYDKEAGNISVAAPGYAGATVAMEIHYAEVVEKLDNKYLDLDWLPAKKVVGGDGILFPETSIQFTTSSALVPGFTAESLQVGGKYTAYWNGAAYQSECYLGEDGELMLGNGSLAGYSANTGEPFCLVNFGGTGMMIFKETAARETVTIKLVGRAEYEYNRMPAGYMPEFVDSIVLRSSGGKKFMLTVNNGGALTTAEVI